MINTLPFIITVGEPLPQEHCRPSPVLTCPLRRSSGRHCGTCSSPCSSTAGWPSTHWRT
jgi:hypothetical protein